MSPARWPLWLQLAVAFALVVALALGGGGLLLLDRLEDRQLADRSRTILRQANTGANLVAELQRRGESPGPALYRFHQQTGVRILVTDRTGTVRADSVPGALVGTSLTHPELLDALAGGQVTGTRWLGEQGAWVMYGAVPIYEGSDIAGAVLLSADIGALDESLTGMRQLLQLAALASGALAVAFGLGLAGVLTRPLGRLTRAAQGLARGELKTRVVPGGSRELVSLGDSFNAMAVELGRLDQQRRAFVADASHELRTPIAAVRALADGLLRSKGDLADYREYLEDIGHECDRAGRLVDRLLDLARLDMWQEQRAQLTARFEPLDLGALIGEMVHALEPLAQERKVELHWAPPPAPANLRTDSRLLETVLGNLIENGLKYTPPGGNVRITLTPEQRGAVVTVQDTGPGIAAEHLAHIFQRFYRVDTARSRQTGGAGLGLAITKEAADLLGGRIEVTSQVGEGSIFTLYLPNS